MVLHQQLQRLGTLEFSLITTLIAQNNLQLFGNTQMEDFSLVLQLVMVEEQMPTVLKLQFPHLLLLKLVLFGSLIALEHLKLFLVLVLREIYKILLLTLGLSEVNS